MTQRALSRFFAIDWVLFFATLPIIGAGLLTMFSFDGDAYFFYRQIVWAALGIAVFFLLAQFDYRFLRRSDVVFVIFLTAISLLVLVLFIGGVTRGAQSWISFGIFAFQPADPAKLAIIILLAKYFSRRHIEIANIRHILVSGAYAAIPMFLVFIQPDFGSALVIGCIWLGMIMVSGISKKHLLLVFLAGVLLLGGLWTVGFTDEQRERVVSFLNPLADIEGAGYHAYQSTIAVGSGQLWGKGFGYGTQSRLSFLPEYETDFIFAAYAEEWGFIGSVSILLLFGVIFWSILRIALRANSNFETLFAIGVALMLLSHTVINIGMNLGQLPVTGLPLPFMSYGGSHLLIEFAALGMLMGMRRYGRPAHREQLEEEVEGM